MQKIYEQLAEKLGISADDIASAFDQARQELNNQQ
jgi:DNA-directed RNA polymerase specialized sigma24 family protein